MRQSKQMNELLLKPRRRYSTRCFARFSVKEICAIVSDMSTATDKPVIGSTDIRSSDNQTSNDRLTDNKVTDPVSVERNKRLCLLLRQVTEKDKAAFELFYDSTIKLCYSQALRITSRHEIAEEVISDVYMQVWNSAGRYDESKSGAITWLVMLCRSRALDALRQRKRQVQHMVSGLEAMPEPVVDDDSQDILSATHENGRLHDAISQLGTQQRQMLSLAYFRGYTHIEIARYTDIPLGTVKTQIRRAILKLKEIMQGQELPEGGSHE